MEFGLIPPRSRPRPRPRSPTPPPVPLRDLLPPPQPFPKAPPQSWPCDLRPALSQLQSNLHDLRNCILDENQFCICLSSVIELLLLWNERRNWHRTPLGSDIVFRAGLGNNYWNALTSSAPTWYRNVPTQVAVANLLRAKKSQPPLSHPPTAESRGRFGLFHPDLDYHYRYALRQYMGMCWVAEVKVVGVGHERGRCVPDPLLTRDRDWKDWDDYDCYSESEHCHSDLTSDLSSHTSEASEDRQDRLFEHEFGRQWAAGTAKLVLYLLSVYEFCGAYCGSTVIHDKTARFVIVCEEPLTIAVECAQVVLDRIGTGVLPMPGFIGNRDNALHMPTSLALREDETFNSAGMDRLLAFVHAARCAVAPMTDAELVSTARLPPPELDGLGFVGDIRLQAREFDFATVNINMAKDGESLNEVPPLEESKEADFNCDNSRAGDTKDVDDVVEPSANPCRHKRPASQQSNNQNSSKRPHTTKSTRQGGDQADVAADARNVASEKGASFHIELAGSIETGVALAPVQTPVVPTHQDSPAPDAGIAAPTEPRSSNHHTEKQTSISAWAACVSEANLHSDAVPPSSGVDDDISGHATDSGRNNNIISQGRSETDSDYESGDDDRENEERVHLHIHDLLRVIQDRHVLCAPVSVDQMDQIVLYGL